MAYLGPNRRIHKVYVTRNTEYYTRSDICIAVRDRSSGNWLPEHMAMTKSVCGSIKFDNGGVMANTGMPRIGESLFFHGKDLDVITSTVVSVDRPGKTIAAKYAY